MTTSPLLTPVTINKTTFKNRIIMASMVTSYACCNGEVSEKLIRYHQARAAGGVGLNMLEATCVDPAGRSYNPGVNIDDDMYIKGLKRLTSAIHAAGGKAGVQINHAGRLSKPAVSHHPVQLVSFVPGYTAYENSRILDVEDIERIIRRFVDAAARAVEAGFDLIEIHGAHGYLISQFMSPFFNHREDIYGGGFENRMRFPLEIVCGVRRVVGPNFPLSFRCSVEEFLPGSIDLALSCKIASAVVDAGINLFNVSTGLSETNEFTGPPPAIPKGWNADRAETIRRTLKGRALVSVAGRVVDPETAEDILTQNKADLVVMGRALIADPELPAKVAAGRRAAILPCLNCNEGCGGQPTVECVLNPCVGREGLQPQGLAPVHKRVAVVGGGPAGMRAALTAARRGHSVTLYEQSEALGGLLRWACLPPHKDMLARITPWFEHELQEAGVDIRLNSPMDAAQLRALNAEVLLVATGSEPVFPRFAEGTAAISAEAVLGGAAVGRHVLLLGGGMVGCETADLLARRGKTVTIMEMRDALAPDMHRRARLFLLKSLQEQKVNILLQTELLSISPQNEVQARNLYGDVFTLPPFDSLVLALGYRPRNALCRELVREGMAFIPLGDCVHAGKIMDTTHNAHAAALKL